MAFIHEEIISHLSIWYYATNPIRHFWFTTTQLFQHSGTGQPSYLISKHSYSSSVCRQQKWDKNNFELGDDFSSGCYSTVVCFPFKNRFWHYSQCGEKQSEELFIALLCLCKSPTSILSDPFDYEKEKGSLSGIHWASLQALPKRPLFRALSPTTIVQLNAPLSRNSTKIQFHKPFYISAL